MKYFKHNENERSSRCNGSLSFWSSQLLKWIWLLIFVLWESLFFEASSQGRPLTRALLSLVIFGPCQLLKSSAPAVLALRSWLKSFKLAIWHKFQLPCILMWPGYISKRCNRHSVAPVTPADTFWGKDNVSRSYGVWGASWPMTARKRHMEESGPLQFASLGWNYLGDFIYLFIFGVQKKTTKTKTHCDATVWWWRF